MLKPFSNVIIAFLNPDLQPSKRPTCLFLAITLITLISLTLTSYNFSIAFLTSTLLVLGETLKTYLLPPDKLTAFSVTIGFSTFLFIFFEYIFSLSGPWVTPPPFQIGDLIEPCLALPVPFCRQGFFPPPLTSPLPLA